jgi:hypothetical protein
MRKLLRLAAATAVSASLTTGLAAAQTGTIDTTGPNSHNTVKVQKYKLVRQTNNNRVKCTCNQHTARLQAVMQKFKTTLMPATLLAAAA